MLSYFLISVVLGVSDAYASDASGIYVKNGKWSLGYEDRIILEPKYDEIVVLDGYNYKFKQNNKWGLINTNDETVLEPKYDYILGVKEKYKHPAFSKNLEPIGKYAIVKIDDKIGLGLVGMEGNWVVKPNAKYENFEYKTTEWSDVLPFEQELFFKEKGKWKAKNRLTVTAKQISSTIVGLPVVIVTTPFYFVIGIMVGAVY